MEIDALNAKKSILERSHIFSLPCSIPSPALFLDRDGVVIEDCHYLSDPNQVRLCLGARRLIEHAYRQGVPVILITNQSGICRGFFQWEHFDMVNDRMQELLGAKAQFAAIYANGYGPNAGHNSWRKPSPQMLFQASRDLNIDLSRSMIVGDRLSDLQAGDSAGLSLVFHVLSGHGSKARPSVVEWQRQQETISTINCQSPHKLSKLRLLSNLEDFPYSLLVTGDVAS